MPTPVRPAFTLNDQEKMGAFAALLPLTLDTLQSYHPDVEISGDDILDYFSLSIAALLENDSNITSPKDTRLAVESVTTHVKRWAKSLRDQRPSDDAPSFLAHVIQQDRETREGA